MCIRDSSKGDGPAAAAVFIPLLGMMCSMGLIAFSLSPFFLEQLVGHARTPEELLQGYSQWYIAVISAVASAILIGAVAVILYWKWGIGVEKGIRLMLLTMAFPLLLGGFMPVSYTHLDVYKRQIQGEIPQSQFHQPPGRGAEGVTDALRHGTHLLR